MPDITKEEAMQQLKQFEPQLVKKLGPEYAYSADYAKMVYEIQRGVNTAQQVVAQNLF